MRIIIWMLLISLFSACRNSDEKKETQTGFASKDEIRLKQYRVQGAKVYRQYCLNCHQQNGKGLASLYPPLDGSDYLMSDIKRAACIIKNGQNKEIVVNGVTYNMMMPANPLTNLEVAEVLTFITNAWSNEAGLSGVKEVEKWLEECEE